MNTIFVYGLVDPDTNEVRYVGKTHNMRFRMWQHCAVPRDAKSPREIWIRGLLEAGKKPKMILLEECPNGVNWENVEKRWIAHYRLSTNSLTNVAPGGGGTAGINRKKYPFKTSPIGIPDEDARRLDLMAEITGRSKADVVRAALREYLKKFFEEAEG